MRSRLATLLILFHVASASLTAYGSVAAVGATGAPAPQHAMEHVSAPHGDLHQAHAVQQEGHCDHVSHGATGACEDCDRDTGCTCCYLCCTLYVTSPMLNSPATPHQEVSSPETRVAPAGITTAIYRPPRR